jgi:branched-subunit amino acid aminotransferase/4-amino-4-deoxychorismate lyase
MIGITAGKTMAVKLKDGRTVCLMSTSLREIFYYLIRERADKTFEARENGNRFQVSAQEIDYPLGESNIE